VTADLGTGDVGTGHVGTGDLRTVPRLKTRYETEVAPVLKEQLGVGNVMQVPRLLKIVVNMGVGDAAQDAKLIDAAVVDLRTITGQQPRVNRARKSVANFKIREGQPIGASVTLRGARMWEFFDRLLATAIPRIRDFRGLSPRGFDGRGNYSFGVTEQLIFPEVEYDSVVKVRGMNITFVTTAETDEQGRALLDAFGFPFRRQQAGV
jgi:large subunit ribosomal protein L5